MRRQWGYYAHQPSILREWVSPLFGAAESEPRSVARRQLATFWESSRWGKLQHRGWRAKESGKNGGPRVPHGRKERARSASFRLTGSGTASSEFLLLSFSCSTGRTWRELFLPPDTAKRWCTGAPTPPQQLAERKKGAPGIRRAQRRTIGEEG